MIIKDKNQIIKKHIKILNFINHRKNMFKFIIRYIRLKNNDVSKLYY